MGFQSTLPARGATAIACLTDTLANFNPRSPHGERHSESIQPLIGADFNPRSPHGERPNCTSWGCYLQHNFNPRSPHGERLFSDAFDVRLQHFNPRSPHGERRLYGSHARRLHHFNPRSPHGERHIQMFIGFARQRFQSTLPARGATNDIASFVGRIGISIHAPRTGSDHFRHALQADQRHFNPRSPHGERPFFSSNLLEWHTFQSTLPARGATLEDQ